MLKPALFFIVALFFALPAHADSPCEDHLFEHKRAARKRFTPIARQVRELVRPVMDVPKYSVIFEIGDDERAEWETRRIFVHPYVTAPVAVHEIGHLIFWNYLEKHAPRAMKARRSEFLKATRYDPNSLDSLINSYGEQFCDFLAMLVTGKTSTLAGTQWAVELPDRDWATLPTLPWEEVPRKFNFKRNKYNEYFRLGELRRPLMEKYRDMIFGKALDRQRILFAVTDAMAAEIAATFESNLTDKLRNRRLIEAIETRLKLAQPVR